jgi:hypothetical protein
MPTLPPMMNVPTFITPLPRERLLEPGVEFAHQELTRRVLSVFWQDCCVPLQFSRAPAPVIELMANAAGGREPVPVRAWWLLEDGILEESGGPESERLKPYLQGDNAFQLWPRYEFQVTTLPFEARLCFQSDALTQQLHRVQFATEPFGRVRVVAREVL